jgi:hypothetical protein
MQNKRAADYDRAARVRACAVENRRARFILAALLAFSKSHEKRRSSRIRSGTN